MDFKNVSAPVLDIVGVEVEKRRTTENEVIKQIADGIISPVLISFVWWVLTDALKNGRRRLYFLARDGYIMYKIACQFCARFDTGIELRYLCGSRLAWRNAVYDFIGDEKYKYIFSGGYSLTPKVILKRVQADSETRRRIYDDINRDIHIHSDRYYLSNENQTLNSKSMKIFAERLKKSRIFGEYLSYTSKKRFEEASGYLKQEGLFDGNDIILVDSGWTGSVQRTLRQIVERNVKTPVSMTGYYFGLYAKSNDACDGRYEAWYFNPKSPIRTMTDFNNNVFECMCASPFNMTVGYEFSENVGKYVPAFKSVAAGGENDADKLGLIEYIEDFTTGFLKDSGIEFGDYNDARREKSAEMLRRFMLNPTKSEAEAFGKLKFCDDASESYENNLARVTDEEYLKSYAVINRLWRKVSGKKNKKNNKNKDAIPDLFWFHGSLVLSGVKNHKYYRSNYKLWEFLRLLIKKYGRA